MEISIPQEFRNKKKHANCHLMPCKIEFSGEANVSEYLDNYLRQNDTDKDLTCSFRGRPLLGKKIEVPENYLGVVIKKTESLDGKTCLETTEKFSSYNYWNLDKIPSENDMLMKLEDAIAINKCIHADSNL